MDASTPSAELRNAASPASRRPLILLCLGQMLLQLDFSIVNIALPSMQQDLGFTPVALQWVVTGYALAFGSLLLFGGRLADVVGHRRMLIIGLVAFAVTSFTGGFADLSGDADRLAYRTRRKCCAGLAGRACVSHEPLHHG